MSSIASGRVSANSAVSSSSVSALAVAPAGDRAGHEVGADRRGASVRPEPRRGMKLQYFVLMTSSTPWATHSGSMYCG